MDRTNILASFVLGALSFAAIGCGTTKPPPETQAPVAAPSPSPAPPANEPVPAAAAPVAPAGKEPAKAHGKSIALPSKSSTTPASASPVAKEPTAMPVATAAPAKAPSTAPAPAAVPASSPVAPAASTHEHVGPEKCMMCHRLQYTSWSASKHKAKGLDCEGCHGNGGDYKTIPVMKDLVVAKKAGLIIPTLVFCKKCHADADASFVPTAHAHKAK